MKKIFLSVILFACSIPGFSQADTTAPYLKTKTLPDFRLITIDSVEFNQTILDETKNTIIMLFNPECDHCRHQLEVLLSIRGIAQSTQIILSSTETQEKNRAFYNKNHLEKYPFVHLGKDFRHFFGGYYKPVTIPVLAIYNPQKQLVFFNQGEAKKQEVEQVLK